MNSIANVEEFSIVDALVIHREDGFGKVKSHSDGRVAINIGRPVFSSFTSDNANTLRRADRTLSEMIAEEENGYTVTVPEERFFNHLEWSLAPSQSQFLQVRNDIRTRYSSVIVPTLNPTNPADAKDAIEEQIRRFLVRHRRPSFDDRFTSLKNQVMFLLDSQLSWFLIRGHENYRSYQERLVHFERMVMQHRGWSQCISSSLAIDEDGDEVDEEVFEDANERIMSYARMMVHMFVAYDNIDYNSAIQRTVDLFEDRIELYRSVIAGFTRSSKRSR